MKIILEGTAEELRNILLFGIPQNIVSDDDSQFLCGDIAGRGHRRKKAERTFSELKAIAENHLNDFLETDKTKRPQPVKFTVGFMSDSDNSEIKALAKEHADRRRQVREQLNLLSEQDIPKAVANYFNGRKLSVSFEKRRLHE